jgi:prepilin-type N-terminal cleavage/methylation domain-containing protein
MSTRRDGEAGYTLVELAVTMSVFLIFMSFATPVMFSAIQQGMRTEDRIDLQNAGRAALRTMTRELRQAETLYASTDKPSAKNSLSFAVDLNGDSTINSYANSALPLEEITYYVQSGTLYRGRKQGQGVPLAEHVSGLQFTMFGSNPALDTDGDGVVEESELNTNGDSSGGNPIWQESELVNVTRVDMSLSLAQDEVEQTYTARVFLRNRAGD